MDQNKVILLAAGGVGIATLGYIIFKKRTTAVQQAQQTALAQQAVQAAVQQQTQQQATDMDKQKRALSVYINALYLAQGVNASTYNVAAANKLINTINADILAPEELQSLFDYYILMTANQYVGTKTNADLAKDQQAVLQKYNIHFVNA